MLKDSFPERTLKISPVLLQGVANHYTCSFNLEVQVLLSSLKPCKAVTKAIPAAFGQSELISDSEQSLNPLQVPLPAAAPEMAGVAICHF